MAKECQQGEPLASGSVLLEQVHIWLFKVLPNKRVCLLLCLGEGGGVTSSLSKLEVYKEEYFNGSFFSSSLKVEQSNNLSSPAPP